VTQLVNSEFIELQEILAGRYSIERELGRGGMGIVLLARDVALDRLVAIKLLPKGMASQPELRERFLREARTAAGLSHPNIVPIHTVEEHGDFVFFVMGFVDGETLRERVERTGPLTPRATLRLLQEVSWALAHAHQSGIVHRDVKPENIMLERASDRALVTDFGIAVPGGGSESDPDRGVVGTARYMSPEQACGEPVDARSDLYSLGATAFFALTGRAPFEAPTVPALLAKHVTEPPPKLIAARPETPDKLAAIVDRCLQKDPEERFPSGDEMARAVSEARGRELRAPPVVRNFLRNAEVSTAVILTIVVFGPDSTAGSSGVNIEGLQLVSLFLLFQLGLAARRLLRTGYTFDDIREALLAEARVQEEEAEAVKRKKWARRISGAWNRIWASKFGRFFFRISGVGLAKPERTALPSADPTELVLGNAATEIYLGLPDEVRSRLPDVPRVIERLERDAEKLRQRGETGERLTLAVGALENVRLGLLRLRAGMGTVDGLTEDLARAQEIGDDIDAELSARREVDAVLDSRPGV
jgi:serine/threonine-protein kinase